MKYIVNYIKSLQQKIVGKIPISNILRLLKLVSLIGIFSLKLKNNNNINLVNFKNIDDFNLNVNKKVSDIATKAGKEAINEVTKVEGVNNIPNINSNSSGIPHEIQTAEMIKKYNQEKKKEPLKPSEDQEKKLVPANTKGEIYNFKEPARNDSTDTTTTSKLVFKEEEKFVSDFKYKTIDFCINNPNDSILCKFRY
jgi:hypothetical protein